MRSLEKKLVRLWETVLSCMHLLTAIDVTFTNIRTFLFFEFVCGCFPHHINGIM